MVFCCGSAILGLRGRRPKERERSVGKGGGGVKNVWAQEKERDRERARSEKRAAFPSPFDASVPRSLIFSLTRSHKHYTMVILFSTALRDLGSGSACHFRTLSLENLACILVRLLTKWLRECCYSRVNCRTRKKKKTTTTTRTTTTK